MARGWQWIDEGKAPDPESREHLMVKVEADLLMEEWSSLRERDEQDTWRRMRIAEGDHDHEEPDFEDDEDRIRYEKQQEIADRKIQDRRAAIEERLAELNIRPMRPYEHWNEEESYMQYMECGRFGEDPGW